MDPQFLLQIMAVFTGVAAVALLIMMGMMIGVFRSVLAVRQRSIAFMDRCEPLADSTLKSVEKTAEQSKEVLADIKELTAKGRTQMDKVDELLTDVSRNARVQLERIDDGVQTSVDRLNYTTEALQTTILQPVRQVRALGFALGAFVDQLSGSKRRPTPDKATLDEEMFI